MLIQSLHPDVTLFTFEEGDTPFDQPTSVMVVRGQNHAFLVDTHCGPLSMTVIQEHLHRECRNLPLVVFNTHADWDHVWGNCAFPDAELVAHQETRRILETEGAESLATMGQYCHGEVTVVPPRKTFRERFEYPEDGVKLEFLPGHTEDSSVFYHQPSGVLFVGDLVEDPIPWLGWPDLARYQSSLQRLLDYGAKIIVSSHSAVVGTDLVMSNLAYLQAMQQGIDPVIAGDAARSIHDGNLKTMSTR